MLDVGLDVVLRKQKTPPLGYGSIVLDSIVYNIIQSTFKAFSETHGTEA